MLNLDTTGTALARGWFISFGFLIAATVGTAIGSSNAPVAIGILVGGGLIGYLLIFHQLTWQPAVLICFLDFTLEPLGFRFGALELSCLLGFSLYITHIWQKRVDTLHTFFRSKAFRFFRAALFLWLLYAIPRFVWNYIEPFNPAEYAFSNAFKSEFSITAIILLMWLFSFCPRVIAVKRGFGATIAFLLLIGLYVNIAIRIYGVSQGIFENPSTNDIDSALSIPFLNLTENQYSLRFAAPTAVLYGLTFLTSPRIRRPLPWRFRMLYYGLILGGFFGAAISGGRGSFLFASGFCVFLLILRRKFLAMAVLGLLASTGFGLLNMFSQRLADDPDLALIQRSLYWAMTDQADWAATSIDSSTRWRQELFQRAIDEWKSDWMIVWLGRGTYKYSDEDRSAIETNGYEGLMDTSLRRGATHNLVSDLLIMYGAVGLVLYLLVCFALIRVCFSVATNSELPEEVTDLGLISGIVAVFTVGYGIIAGEFIKHYLGWFVMIFLARIAQSAFESTKEIAQEPCLKIVNN
jgi:O-antigen ligase